MIAIRSPSQKRSSFEKSTDAAAQSHRHAQQPGAQAKIDFPGFSSKTPILEYLHDAKMRDRVPLQLNRGEGRHTRCKRISLGNQRVYRTGDVDELMNKGRALSVLSSAVLV